MKLERLIVGPVRTNCYLIQNEETKEVVIVDPGDQAIQIRSRIIDMGGQPTAVLLTHGHFDHILGVPELRKMYPEMKVYALEAEQELLEDPHQNISDQLGRRTCSLEADNLLHDGQMLTLAGFQIEVLATPGHTVGSCCYYLPEEKCLFSGDTLFAESVGRTDLPTGSAAQIGRSVKKLLERLPEETDVYPGHEYATSIEHEKRYNPFA